MTGIAFEAPNGSGKAAEQPVGAGSDRVEHRLHVRRRAGDDLQDFGRAGLSLQRLPCLIEQPRVLDRDQRLVAEGFQPGRFRRGRNYWVVFPPA